MSAFRADKVQTTPINYSELHPLAGPASVFHMSVGQPPLSGYAVDATFSKTLEDGNPNPVSEPTHQHIDLFYHDHDGGTGRLTIDHLLSDVLDTTCAISAAPRPRSGS